jgi:hypothetical protein
LSSIDAKHKAYLATQLAWQKVRDFVAGGDAVRTYVQTLPGHDTDTATAFRNRAYYLPAIARTIDAFTGLIMNPEPVVQTPAGLEEYLDDVSYDGEPAARMMGRTVRETIELGRCAVVVDYPQAPGADQLSIAEAEAQGLRAYARFYAAEDVLDWRMTTKGAMRVLSFLKLRENYDAPSPTDEWAVTEVKQIRVLDLEGGFYRQRVYRLGDVIDERSRKVTSTWEQIGGDIFPMASGAKLTEIPAVVFGPDTLDASQVDVPPVMEMVQIADAHLQNSALMEWTLLWVGNPTPVFRGIRLAEGETIKLGSSQGIAVDAEGGAEMLFLPADGVGAIATQMDRKEKHMAAVGARLLQDETSSQIARDTAIIQRAGEHSVLANIATTVAAGWKRILGYLAMWARVTGDIGVTLNTDFIPQGVTAGELTERIAAVQAGTLSSRDLFAWLQKRGEIRPDKTFDEHLDEVDEDGQRVLELPPGAPGGPPAEQNPDQQADEQQAA